MASAQANIHTYLAPLTGSGRTAPSLLEDVTLYDPHFQSQPGQNLLKDGPINFTNAQYIYQYLPEGTCRHEFYLEPRQTRVPSADERPDQNSIYQVAAVCKRCRIHLFMKVDYTSTWKGDPCPTAEHPLHHLIRSTYRDNLAHGEVIRSEYHGTGELYAYQCSSSTCSAVVTIRLTPAVISEEAVRVLIDPELLKQRTDEAFSARSGDTEGMRRPSATDVLTDLRTYMRNSWKNDSKSEISLDNKRFAVRFGPGGAKCAEVLESLAFVLKPGVAWQVPKPSPESALVLEDPFNIFLDNIEHEISVLILNQPSHERQISQDSTSLASAYPYLAQALGCRDYEKSKDSRSTTIDVAFRPMPFTVLGVPQDLSDEIISSAYDWQCAHHVEGAPHYLSALQSIAMQRSSEALDTKCAIEQSNGRVTYEQLVEAYKALGLSMNVTSDPDHIIGTFESRASDARNQEPQLRENLRVIGVGLNSNKIKDHASQEMSTYEQALTYLGVTSDTSDDFVRSVFTLKVNDHASQMDMATKAVKLIAMHRRSEALNAWITSGFTAEVQTQMDIGEAYQTLEIADRTMDDDTILAVYNVRKSEVTDADRFTRALTAIAQSRSSPLLLSELQMTAPQASKAALSEPVGLDNIGNTCYLNSLLQFLFTIKVVRDIVLEFDRYKMELTPENMSVKKVGQRKISLKEVETAQKFVASLGQLFQSMITASKTAIRPEQELARLTLETDQVKEKIRRRSTLGGGGRPSLGTINSIEIQGPLLPPSETTSEITQDAPLMSPVPLETTNLELNSADGMLTQSPRSDTPMVRDEDNSSEATLVSRPGSGTNSPIELVSTEQQQAIFDDKENLAPTKLLPSKESHVTGQPLRPASPSKINAQAGAISNKSDREEIENANEQPMYEPPPGPPPVPPRKPVAQPTMTLEEYARQQDVTEVIGHCLFQLSCAMRATGFDKSGEQQDEIHDLFFGQCRGHTLPEKSGLDTPLPFLNVQAAVINQPKDVYAALDNYFDLSDAGNGRKGYISITQLPPVLTITLGRVIWDSKTNSQKKLDHHVDMPQILYMDRYLETDSDSPLMRKREQSWAFKEEVAELVVQKDALEERHAESADVPALFDDARRCLEYLEKEVTADPKLGGPIEIDPGLKDVLGHIAGQKRAELESAKGLIRLRKEQLQGLFTDLQSQPYVLHAAFFHRGSHGSGHYWVYILDHKTGLWRKYNDDHVTVVHNLAEIFERPDTSGGWSGPANPYFLVYIKQGDVAPTLEELVETVKREPITLDEDDIDIEPLGTGTAIAQGLLGASSGRAQTQMSEMPPESVGPNWRQTGGLRGAGDWAGNGVTASGVSTGDGELKDQSVNDWQYFEANPDMKW